MNHNFHCPSCQTKVSFIRMMFYIPPFTIKCKNCKERMQVAKSPVVTFAILYSYFATSFMIIFYFFNERINFFDIDNNNLSLIAGICLWLLITELPIYYSYKKYNIKLIKEINFLTKSYKWTLILQILLLGLVLYLS